MEAQLHRTTHDHHGYEEDPHHNVALPSGERERERDYWFYVVLINLHLC